MKWKECGHRWVSSPVLKLLAFSLGQCILSGLRSYRGRKWAVVRIACICATRYIKHLAQSTCSVNSMKWNWEMTMETWHPDYAKMWYTHSGRVCIKGRSPDCFKFITGIPWVRPGSTGDNTGLFLTCLYILCCKWASLLMNEWIKSLLWDIIMM